MKRLDAKVIGLGKGKKKKWTSENFKIFIFGYCQQWWWQLMTVGKSF